MADDFQREADPADQASQVELQYIQERIEANRRGGAGPVATGFCLDPYCGEQLLSDEELAQPEIPADAQRFCGPECRDNWQKEQDRLKRNKSW